MGWEVILDEQLPRNYTLPMHVEMQMAAPAKEKLPVLLRLQTTHDRPPEHVTVIIHPCLSEHVEITYCGVFQMIIHSFHININD